MDVAVVPAAAQGALRRGIHQPTFQWVAWLPPMGAATNRLYPIVKNSAFQMVIDDRPHTTGGT
jgi:hypothetical protein